MISFSPVPNLATRRLDLKQYGLDDLNAIFELRTNVLVNKYTDRPIPKSHEEVATFIQKIQAGIQANEMIGWGIYPKNTQQMVGSIGYWKFNDAKTEAYIGYELHPDYWGKGLMQEAYEATMPQIKSWGFQKIRAWVSTSNALSINFLERNNFQKERMIPAGQDGDSSDSFVFQLQLAVQSNI